MTALPAVVNEQLGVGAGGELVDGTGQSVPGLLDLVVESARRCARDCGLLQSSVSQHLVLAVPACTLVSTLALKR
jgi:hypothetical protein